MPSAKGRRTQTPHQKYYLLYTPSEQFRRVFLKLQNMSLSPTEKFQKILIFFVRVKERLRRQEQRDKQMFHSH